jgi:hypothetical protein
MEIVEFFNRIALLVATEILAEETPQARARVISKVIQVSKPQGPHLYNKLLCLNKWAMGYIVITECFVRVRVVSLHDTNLPTQIKN